MHVESRTQLEAIYCKQIVALSWMCTCHNDASSLWCEQNGHSEKRTTSVEWTNCQYTVTTLLPLRHGQLLISNNGLISRHMHTNKYIFQIFRGTFGWECQKPHKLDSMDGSVQATQGIGGPHKYLPYVFFFIFLTDTKLFPAISQQSLKINVAFKRNKKGVGMGLLEYILLCPVVPAHCHLCV